MAYNFEFLNPGTYHKQSFFEELFLGDTSVIMEMTQGDYPFFILDLPSKYNVKLYRRFVFHALKHSTIDDATLYKTFGLPEKYLKRGLTDDFRVDLSDEEPLLPYSIRLSVVYFVVNNEPFILEIESMNNLVAYIAKIPKDDVCMYFYNILLYYCQNYVELMSTTIDILLRHPTNVLLLTPDFQLPYKSQGPFPLSKYDYIVIPTINLAEKRHHYIFDLRTGWYMVIDAKEKTIITDDNRIIQHDFASIINFQVVTFFELRVRNRVIPTQWRSNIKRNETAVLDRKLHLFYFLRKLQSKHFDLYSNKKKYAQAETLDTMIVMIERIMNDDDRLQISCDICRKNNAAYTWTTTSGKIGLVCTQKICQNKRINYNY